MGSKLSRSDKCWPLRQDAFQPSMLSTLFVEQLLVGRSDEFESDDRTNRYRVEANAKDHAEQTRHQPRLRFKRDINTASGGGEHRNRHRQQQQDGCDAWEKLNSALWPETFRRFRNHAFEKFILG
jgi:hypothetical protein